MAGCDRGMFFMWHVEQSDSDEDDWPAPMGNRSRDQDQDQERCRDKDRDQDRGRDRNGDRDGDDRSRSKSRNKQTTKLVLVRHGESTWNQENRFTGWYDADLSDKGVEEAKTAAQAIKDAGIEFDIAYTSVLKRAVRTLSIIMDETEQTWIPVVRTWRLNERHYGALTGLDKSETASKHGEEQVKIWRRSYDCPPPPMDKNHPHYEAIAKDRRYASLKPGELPCRESLKDTICRVLPFWTEEIVPQLKCGCKVLIVAHGNSLRGIVKLLEGMNEKQIVDLNIPTGIPMVYELDECLKPTKPMEFLGDEETVRQAQEDMKNQGKAK